MKHGQIIRQQGKGKLAQQREELQAFLDAQDAQEDAEDAAKSAQRAATRALAESQLRAEEAKVTQQIEEAAIKADAEQDQKDEEAKAKAQQGGANPVAQSKGPLTTVGNVGGSAKAQQLTPQTAAGAASSAVQSGVSKTGPGGTLAPGSAPAGGGINIGGRNIPVPQDNVSTRVESIRGQRPDPAGFFSSLPFAETRTTTTTETNQLSAFEAQRLNQIEQVNDRAETEAALDFRNRFPGTTFEEAKRFLDPGTTVAEKQKILKGKVDEPHQQAQEIYQQLRERGRLENDKLRSEIELNGAKAKSENANLVDSTYINRYGLPFTELPDRDKLSDDLRATNANGFDKDGNFLPPTISEYNDLGEKWAAWGKFLVVSPDERFFSLSGSKSRTQLVSMDEVVDLALSAAMIQAVAQQSGQPSTPEHLAQLQQIDKRMTELGIITGNESAQAAMSAQAAYIDNFVQRRMILLTGGATTPIGSGRVADEPKTEAGPDAGGERARDEARKKINVIDSLVFSAKSASDRRALIKKKRDLEREHDLGVFAVGAFIRESQKQKRQRASEREKLIKEILGK